MRALILTGTLVAVFAAMPAAAQFSNPLDKAKKAIDGSSGSSSSGSAMLSFLGMHHEEQWLI